MIDDKEVLLLLEVVVFIVLLILLLFVLFTGIGCKVKGLILEDDDPNPVFDREDEDGLRDVSAALPPEEGGTEEELEEVDN